MGRGGTSMVLRAHDRRLSRPVAIKVLLPGLRGDAQAVARFRREAALTAGLDHPGVATVHDAGVLTDGRPWMALRAVRGDTLRALLGAAGGSREGLVTVLLRVAEAVGAAHAAGVVHRDLKPENVMVGPFGETVVMDWGGAVRPEEDQGPTGSTGTTPYMAPELLRFAGSPSPGSDVYSLAVMTFELLEGHLPFAAEQIDDVAAGARLPAPGWTGRRLPILLRDLVSLALTEADTRRPAHASAFAEHLRAWLEGSEGRRRAGVLLEEAALQRKEAWALDEQARRLRSEARTLRGSLERVAPPSAKEPSWLLDGRAEELERGAAEAGAQALSLAWGALSLDPEGAAADWLRDHHRAALVQAERDKLQAEQIRHRALMLRHDHDGSARAWLDTPSHLVIGSVPAGAEVSVRPWIGRLRRALGPARLLGRTPIEVQVEPGSYQIELAHPAFEPLSVPLAVGRGERWPQPAPGERGSPPFHLLPFGSLGGSGRQVAAGWADLGGDFDAIDALAARRVWVDSFVIERDPVTWRSWLEFLHALWETGDPELEERLPQDPLAAQGADAPIRLGPRGPELAGPEPEAPVWLVSLTDARAYCRWRSQLDGLPWRLPTSPEWEKAARGADRRLWPWGDHFEAGWTNMSESRELPGPLPVGELTEDVSPYGVRGLAGNVRDWCMSRWRVAGAVDEAGRALPPEEVEAGALYVVRGGSWNSRPAYCRLAARWADPPGARYRNIGFRMARGLG